MSEFKETWKRNWRKLRRTMKEDRAKRTIAITAVILLLSLSVLVAITAAANRAKKHTPSPTETTSGEITTPESESGSESPSQPSDAKLPDFLLPVSGKLGMKHDATTQVLSTTMQDYRVHIGIDILTSENAAVCAAADGTVAEIWEDVRYGTCVAIAHSGDCLTVYKNLSVELAEGIEKDAKVTAGQLIGTVGGTAMVEVAEEPHLHFEMTVAGLSVDPLEYFGESALASLTIDTAYEG